ncbi:MAG: glycosyltransferase family 2 protein [Coriobacteriia bacterium]|nr:glycosyltransferase family 2 protein [Coriobacteriia bacterium]
MTISIIIPAYNAEKTLARTLDSLLAQTDDRWEAVVVNDGSMDSTFEIAIDYAQRDKRIAVAHQDNGGTASALNTGVSRSSGEFITQLGADDELMPGYIASTRKLMLDYPDFDIYASNASVQAPGQKAEHFNTGPRFAQLTSLTLVDEIEKPQIYGTAAFRRTFYDAVGGFRQRTYNGEDYDFWLRIMAAGARHIYQPESLAIYHASAGQKTSNVLRARRCDLVIMRDLEKAKTLNSVEREAVKIRITRLKHNIRLRSILYKLLGQQRAERLIRRSSERKKDA